MYNRRIFAGLMAGTALLPTLARSQAAPSGIRTTPFYSAVGETLNVYDLDVAAATLTRRQTVAMPASLQYAWPSSDRRFLYTVLDKEGAGASNTKPGDGHYAIVYKIDPATGELSPHGQQVALPQRAIHMSLDRSGKFMITAYAQPANITIHRINADGTLGDAVQQPAGLDFGIYAHFIRAMPSNKAVLMVTRGNNASANRPEQPGAIKIYSLDDNGRLANLQSMAPGGNGINFGPRHMDFSPNGRFAYFSMERNNRLDVFGVNPDNTLTADALFQVKTLRDQGNTHVSGQDTGPIHFHPNGRILYVGNRSGRGAEYNGKRIWVGGENDIAVFAIDPKTGEPKLVQNADTYSIIPRTFAMDPSSKILIAAAQQAMPVLSQDEGARVALLNAGLTIFRVAADGRLTFQRKVDVDTACCKEGQNPETSGIQFWCGSLSMA